MVTNTALGALNVQELKRLLEPCMGLEDDAAENHGKKVRQQLTRNLANFRPVESKDQDSAFLLCAKCLADSNAL